MDCAQTSCVPCAYKVGAFDVALDTTFCAAVPNQRPEQCRRLGNRKPQQSTTSRSHTTTTTTALRILTVGDGDFSFSLAMARQGRCYEVVATSYESKATLERVYDDDLFSSTVNGLEQDYNATVYYNVDATRLQETLPPSVLFGPATGAETSNRSKRYFDRIIWNFPCSAVSNGQDGQNEEMDRNKELVRSFVQSALPLLTPVTGQILMHHKTKPPFDQWKLPELVVAKKDRNNYVYLGRIVLDRALFPPYVPRKALDRKSFSCHDACTFVFGLRQEGATTTTTTTEPILLASPPYPTQLIPVTRELLYSIRRTHLLLRKKNGSYAGSRSRRKKQRKKR